MCGIAGFFDSTLNRDKGLIILDNMLESIAHRGPDARDVFYEESFFLGHNRLSIIDVDERSNQPFFYQGIAVIFNGEIYNYLEIKEELIRKGYSFSTESDTEVLAASYKEWGEKCTEYFVGMWAFVIKDKNKLFCSRDRFGIKPFYYMQHNGTFYFSSEIKALKKCPYYTFSPNIQNVSLAFQLGWTTYKNGTQYKGIYQLEAAHNLVFEDKSISTYKYWQLKNSSNHLSEEESIYKFQQLFSNSIDIHMRSDVSLGCCLSGGLDSSSIVSHIAKSHPSVNINAYHIYYSGKDEVNETPFAREVSMKYKNINLIAKEPKGDELLENFDTFIKHHDGIIPGSSPYSQYFVMQMARQNGTKVIIDGQGADEYLAGYQHAIYRYLLPYLKKGKLLKTLKIINQQSNNNKNSYKRDILTFLKTCYLLFNSEESLYKKSYKHLIPFTFLADFSNKISLDINQDGSHLQAFLEQQTRQTSLQNLLKYEDLNSMAFSIESRVPFLDHRLVEFGFSTPDDLKIKNGVSAKYILRESMKNTLPKKIYKRTDKKGFVTPGEVKWTRGILKNEVDNIDLSKIDFIDKSKAKKLLAQFNNGNDNLGKYTWRMLTLSKWIDNNT